MSLFKKKLTEQEAASHFVLYIIKEAQEAWPTIHKSLTDSFKEKFVVEDEKMAAFDLALAAIAQDLQAVKNLFPKDQAERIEKWVLKCIDTDDYGEYAVDEVRKYGEKFQKDVQNISAGGDPLSAIPARLLQRWLGKNIQNFDVEMNGKKTGIISPVLLMMVSSTLAAFLGSWKKLKDDFNLIEGDLPLNEKLPDLKDYDPKATPSHSKQDGVYKVLIKGPWDGVKEAEWELSPDSVEKFVDENGYAYAMCAYEKGEPKYTLTKKKIWENNEEVEKIIMNPNLSEEQRIEQIKNLAKD